MTPEQFAYWLNGFFYYESELYKIYEESEFLKKISDEYVRGIIEFKLKEVIHD